MDHNHALVPSVIKQLNNDQRLSSLSWLFGYFLVPSFMNPFTLDVSSRQSHSLIHTMVLDTNRRKETNRACYSIFQQSLVVGEGEVVKVPLQPAVHTLHELEAVLVPGDKNIIKIFHNSGRIFHKSEKIFENLIRNI